MLLFDPETLRFLAVNEAMVQHYGYSREEFLTMTIKDIYLKEDIPALLKCVDEAGATPRKTSEWRHRRKDGTIIQVEAISSPLVFGGRKARLVLAARHHGEKMLEEKFLHAQRLESIGMLAAGIAHDLNNVLAPIMLAAPMLRANASNPRDLRILDTLEQNASRGAGLVKQILGFAHSTTGEFRPTQVSHLVQDIINIIEETFPRSIQLQQEISSDLWLVQGNPVRIHQVLLNLCVNARDAMSQGGTLYITATNRRFDAEQARALPGARSGAWLVIEVSDTGTGIAPNVLAHIWDPFFTTKGAEKGTGLGLSTVRGIVASHRGFITVDTQQGRGTTFRVFLPATDEKSADSRVAPVVAAPIGQSELILVVDDNDAIRETVTAVLAKHNYRVLNASDGVEAVSLLTTHQTDIALVITDVDIPYLGGAALTRIATQLCPDLPLLLISGLSNDEKDGSPLEAAKKLAHACLLKPFAPEVLLETVHQLLHLPKILSGRIWLKRSDADRRGENTRKLSLRSRSAGCHPVDSLHANTWRFQHLLRVVGVTSAWRQLQIFLERSHGLRRNHELSAGIHCPIPEQNRALDEIRVRLCRIERDGFVRCRDRAIYVPRIVLGGADIEPRRGRMGIELNRPLVARHGFLVLF